MDGRIKLIERYHTCKAVGIKVADMDASALAGYYLSTFPGDPIAALDIDINATQIPTSTGKPARIIVLSVLGSNKI